VETEECCQATDASEDHQGSKNPKGHKGLPDTTSVQKRAHGYASIDWTTVLNDDESIDQIEKCWNCHQEVYTQEVP
jgi:hypothetical protein